MMRTPTRSHASRGAEVPTTAIVAVGVVGAFAAAFVGIAMFSPGSGSLSVPDQAPARSAVAVGPGNGGRAA